MVAMITACLSWYREQPAWLERCVRSLVPLCDGLVALGGRWELFPGETDASSVEEAKALLRAADEVGLPAAINRGGLWESQVAKRDALIDTAGALGDGWLLVIDGDEYLEPFTADEAAAARATLAETSLDVAELLCVPLNRSWPFRELPVNDQPLRRFFRAGTRLPGPAHNGYVFEGRWLNGDLAYIKREPALDLTGLVRLAHDNQNREPERKLAAKDYRQARREQRVEAWR
jgi:hypothetical protein